MTSWQQYRRTFYCMGPSSRFQSSSEWTSRISLQSCFWNPAPSKTLHALLREPPPTIIYISCIVKFPIFTNLIFVVVPPTIKSVVKSCSKILFIKNKWSNREPLKAITLIFFFLFLVAKWTRKSRNWSKQSSPSSNSAGKSFYYRSDYWYIPLMDSYIAYEIRYGVQDTFSPHVVSQS